MKERNEKPKAYLATLISIIVPALNFFNLIPQPVKTNIFFKIFVSTIIVLAAVLMYRMIRKLVTLKLPATKFLWHSLSILFFGTCILIVCLQTSSKIIPTDTVQYQKTSKNGNNIILQADTLSGNQTVNGDNNQLSSRETTINAKYYQGGRDNTMNISEYNTPPQRHINKTDITKLKRISFKEKKIRVLYPENNNEAAKYADEVWNKLFDLGYKPFSKASYKKSTKSSTNRFDIISTEEPEHIINITVNSQL